MIDLQNMILPLLTALIGFLGKSWVDEHNRKKDNFNQTWIQHRSATHPKLDFTSSGVLNPSTFLGRLFKLSSID